MKILLISPYHTGSHRAWAEGYAGASSNEVLLLTLPGRYWKWRMHGGSVTLARIYLREYESADLILSTDMLDLTTFLSLTRSRTASTPTVVYMHENQMTYPLPQDPETGPMRRQQGERDLHYAFVNYVSMLAADRVVFNSRYHRDQVLAALPKFLRHFPEYRELATVGEICRKATVLPVGVDYNRLRSQKRLPDQDVPPLVIWNQRWEYDKNPAAFFRALIEVEEAGLAFRLALCGEMFERCPREFEVAVERLEKRIIHVGYAERERYQELLREAEITVSTAHHEFFGISFVEAMACETFPILPEDLSYPELVPADLRQACFYSQPDEIPGKLRWAIENRSKAHRIAVGLGTRMSRFDWAQVAAQYDLFFRSISPSPGCKPTEGGPGDVFSEPDETQ